MTFRREESPFFAALMEENGGSLTDRETKRRLKICLRRTGCTQNVFEVLSEQTKPPAEDDLLPDVKGDFLDLRPTSQQSKRWNLGDPKDQREILWLIRKKRPEASHRIRQVHTVLYSLVP